MKGNLFKIRPGKLEKWKDWCYELENNLREEALITLKEEKCTQELFILFSINEDFYTVGMGEGECLPATLREINIKHKEISKECLEKIDQISTLYHLKL